LTIEFHCPYCGKLLKTLDDKAGLRANCPQCAELVTVPSPSGAGAEIEALDSAAVCESDRPGTPPAAAPMKTCPMCAEKVPAAASKCPYCDETFRPGDFLPKAVAPHRSGIVLALAIAGICFSPCGSVGLALGIGAWVMGHIDLKAIEAGQRDRAGESRTRLGRNLGIAAVGLAGLAMFLWIGLMILGALGDPS